MTATQRVVESLDWVHATAVSSPAAETVIQTTDVVFPGINPQTVPGAPVRIRTDFNITTGTAATAIVVNLRQGTTTGGTLVASRTITVAAATEYQWSIFFTDTTGTSAQEGGIQYSVTLQETGASAAGTVSVIDTEVSQ